MSKPDEYVVGGTVQAGDGLYIERAADEELLVLCRTRAFVYILSTRQVGKSSLMTHTAETLAREGVHSVIIDLSESGVAEVTAEQWYLGLLRGIQEQSPIEIDVQSWWAEQKNLPYGQRLTSFLKDVLLKQISAPVVIFVDEIDTTRSLTFTDDFYAAIRSIYNARARVPEYERLSFVLVGVATPTDLIRDTKRTPFNIGQRVELSDFTFKEALPLTIGLGLSADKAQQILAHVLKWTGGHPYLTLSVFRQIAEEIQKGKLDWSENDIDHVVDRTFLGSDGDSNLRFVRDMLTVHAPDLENVLNTYRAIFRGRNPVPDEERSLVKSHLKLSGVVQSENANLYVRNNIYRKAFDEQWIRSHLPINWPKRLQRVASIAVVLFFIALLPLSIYAWNQKVKAERAANSEHVARQEAERAAKSERLARQEAERAANSEHVARQEAERAAKSERLARQDADAQRRSAELQKQIAESAAASERSAKQLAESRRKTAETAAADAREAKQKAEAAEKRAQDAKGEAEARGQVAFARQLEIQAEGSLDKNDTAAAEAFLANALLLDDRNETRSRLLDTITQSARKLWASSSQPTNPPMRYEMSSDGRLLASNVDDKEILIWDTQSGVVKHRLSGLEGSVFRILLSPNGQTVTALSFAADSGAAVDVINVAYKLVINSYDIATGQRTRRVSDQAIGNTYHVVSSNGEWLGLQADQASVYILNLKTGKAKTISGVPSFSGFAFSPDGRIFAAQGPDRVIRFWDTDTDTKNEIRRLNPQASNAVDPAGDRNQIIFSQDGNLLASWGTTYTSTPTSVVGVWDVKTGKERKLSGSDPIADVAFGPDGKQLYLLHDTGVVDFWNFERDQTTSQPAAQPQIKNFLGSEFSADGRQIAFRVDDQRLRIWDIEKSRVVGTLTIREEPFVGHKQSVRSIAFSPVEKLVASAGVDSNVLLWETETGRFVRALTGNTLAVNSVAFSANGELVASGGDDAQVRLWEVRTGKTAQTFVGQGAINCVAFSPTHQLLASAGADNTIHIWDLTAQREAFAIPQAGTSPDPSTSPGPVSSPDRPSSERKGIRSIAFSPDGQWIASAGDDPIIRVYNLQTAELLESFSGHRGSIESIAVSSDGTIASAGSDGTIRFWHIRSKEEFYTTYVADAPIHSIAFSPDGRRLAVGLRSGNTPVRLFNVKSSKWITALRAGGGPFAGLIVGENVAFSPDGRFLGSGSSDRKLRLWQLDDPLSYKEGAVGLSGFAFSPGGKLFAFVDDRGGPDSSPVVLLRDASSGQEERRLTVTGRLSSSSLAFSPDGRLLALSGVSTAVGPGKPTASIIHTLVWEVATGTVIGDISEPGGEVSRIAFSPDGNVVALGERKLLNDTTEIGENKAVLHNLKTGKAKSLVFKGGVVWSIAFSPDGNFIAMGGGGRRPTDNGTKAVTVWNLAADKELFSFAGKGGAVLSLAFTPERGDLSGKWLLALGEGNSASNAKDQTLRLLDARGEMEPSMFSQFTETVTGVSLCPSKSCQNLLATDGEVFRVWNLNNVLVSAEDSLTLERGRSFYHTSFSSDGKWLATATFNGSKLWNMEQVNWILNSPAEEIVKGVHLRSSLDVKGIDELGFTRLTQSQLKERLGKKYRSNFTLIPLVESSEVPKPQQ